MINFGRKTVIVVFISLCYIREVVDTVIHQYAHKRSGTTEKIRIFFREGTASFLYLIVNADKERSEILAIFKVSADDCIYAIGKAEPSDVGYLHTATRNYKLPTSRHGVIYRIVSVVAQRFKSGNNNVIV